LDTTPQKEMEYMQQEYLNDLNADGGREDLSQAASALCNMTQNSSDDSL
jgi:hypothetical protein